MARHGDFTGGDGEVDRYVLIAVLDREGRFAVEGGVVCTVDLRLFDRQRVDRDGVGVGVGIGGYLLSVYRVGRFIFGKRCLIQIPFFHLVFAKGFRRDAGGQGIPDGAGAQAGDDGLGDFCKFYVQLLCIVRIVGKLLTCFWLRRNFSAQIFTDGNLAPVVRNINCFTCIKADRVELGRNVLNPCRSGNRTIVYLIGALLTITMNTILRVADRQFGVIPMPPVTAVFLQAVRWPTIRQGDHVLDCTPDRVIVQQILRIGQTGIQVRTAFRAQSLDVFQNSLINIRIRYVDPRLYGFSLFCKGHNRNIAAKVTGSLPCNKIAVVVELQAAIDAQEVLCGSLGSIQAGYAVLLYIDCCTIGQSLMQISRVPSRTVTQQMISIAIRGALIFAVIVFIKIIFAHFCLTVKSFIRMLALFFRAALRAICHRAGGVEHQDGRGFAGVLLGLLQDDFQRDFICVVTRFRCSLVDTFDASGQRLG